MGINEGGSYWLFQAFRRDVAFFNILQTIWTIDSILDSPILTSQFGLEQYVRYVECF